MGNLTVMRFWRLELIAVLLFLYMIVSGCQPTPVAEPLAEPISVPTETLVRDDEADIYVSAIRYLYPEAESFLILKFMQEVSPESSYQDLFGESERQLWEDFVQRNQEVSAVRPDITYADNFAIVTLSDLRREFALPDPQVTYELDWVAMREAYPGLYGILDLTQPGYDVTGNQALVKIVLATFTCEEGNLLRLTRSGSAWEIELLDSAEVCA
ncbi:MAG: hypothetical protein KDE59_21175 [Anaerolineales bacterium]|nr:hypothetical protein [Anaerolineales bacterium]